MKILVSQYFFSIVAGFVSSLLLSSISKAQDEEAAAVVKNKHAFEALAVDQRKKYLDYKQSAFEAFQKNKLSSCLVHTIKAEQVFKFDHEIYFWRGMCYAQWHDMENAVKEYKKVIEIYPTNITVNMNLLEIYYFSKKYENSLQMSDRIRAFYNIEDFPRNQIPLIEFKRLVSMTKLLAKFPEFKKQTTKLNNLYNFMDDTPFSYYAQALAYYEKGDKTEADGRVSAAIYVFGVKEVVSWTKALRDAGYIEDYNYRKFLSHAIEEK